jgi:hypothetical protein
LAAARERDQSQSAGSKNCCSQFPVWARHHGRSPFKLRESAGRVPKHLPGRAEG